jgi:hypothetical protein
MGLFDFFSSANVDVDGLGAFERRRGRWQGSITLSPGGTVPLLLAGNRAGPSEDAVTLARQIARRCAELIPVIEAELFEHYTAYRDAVQSGEWEDAPVVPTLERPSDVWPHVTMQRVLIESMGEIATVEFAFRTVWDEEHMLGARFQEWKLIELNGSVI